jgi:Na+-transporting NADH:ubiquinone oxidoreductase subunit A
MASNGVINIKKGFDLNLAGTAALEVTSVPMSKLVVVKPTDFADTFPKLLVEVGNEVKAGDPLFYSKDRPELKFTAPVSGEVVEILRGAKRKILEVRILADKDIQYKDFKGSFQSGLSKDTVTNVLLESGAWHYIKQRPFNVIADPALTPKAIFISGFDSSPLAPDINFVLKDRVEDFYKGVEALSKLGAPIHLSLNKKAANNDMLAQTPGVKVHYFEGPHPAGNVGIQIHHIDPIKNANDIVWCVQPQDVAIIGHLFNTGNYSPKRIIPLAGSEVKAPKYYEVLAGSSIAAIINGALTDGKNRIILGNALTGKKATEEDYIGYYDTMISVLPEGDEPEFFGWLLPGFDKLSLSRTFFTWLNKRSSYVLNTNMHGEPRNFVVTGEYEKVLPMNIMPVQLLKAIMAKDFEKMEQLGIYEVVEEDLALCEFACTSKMQVQEILASGLEIMRKEG